MLELELSLERSVFLLRAAGKFAFSIVIKAVLLDQTEEFLASQIQNEAFIETQLKCKNSFYKFLN